MSEWKNYGDKNFLDYGGCLVRQHFIAEELERHPELSSLYDVFKLDPSSEDGVYSAGLSMIDPDDIDSDSWIDLNAVTEYIGYDSSSDPEILKKEDPEELAAAIVDFYGNYNCCASAYCREYPAPENFLIAKEEVTQWMKKLGAAEYI